jgi:hypothetical protein
MGAMPDAIEFPDGFLPDDYSPILRETEVSLQNHHLILIGRYLAQLHASGLLMRDLSMENVMFRRANGYPVMIDDPIGNVWGFAPEVFAADLFIPAMSFPPDQFHALLFGYVLNAQRLLDLREPGITDAILARAGAQPVDMIRPDRDRGFARASAALGIEPFVGGGDDDGVPPSPELLLWTLAVHNLLGEPAPVLRARLERLGNQGEAMRAAIKSGEDPFLALGKDWQGPERDFLAAVRQVYEERGESFPQPLQMQPQFAFAVLVPWIDDPERRTWARRFGKFWIEALAQFSAAFDPANRTTSINCAQIAHVVLQHIPFHDSAAEDLLQTLRCSDSARSWYHGWEGDRDTEVVHLLAFRNTEGNTLSKFAFRASPDDRPRFLHAAIDAIEVDRRLVGHAARIRRAGTLSGGAAEGANLMLQGAIRRLFMVHRRMMYLVDAGRPIPYSYAYHEELWTRDADDKKSADKKTEVAESLGELEWAMGMLQLFAADPPTAEEALLSYLEWHEAIYGDSWYTSDERIGQNGFTILTSGKFDVEKPPRALRRGCGLVVYEYTSVGDRPAAIMERLHPLPGVMPGNYQGGAA